eukprot:CAMPEP_0202697360 /NCGR_PEP_ID=MMETSP1385-20130828/10685_1 /ASSEMBLY_ACC=CAM_ASM_000861 /TAXON_ID=933848 /ORGANISM="Elphidium margaritaceum" /LENGTH=100 /DNA_ID=CAMNT_0049353797 /DNA_START=343 /DNA_END=645 /DNA_ORIENTATION=-
MKDELITPFFALMDIVSCYFFFIVVWWVLVLLIGLVALFDACKYSCSDDLSTAFSTNADNDDDDGNVDEFREYDREYFSASNNVEIAELTVAVKNNNSNA